MKKSSIITWLLLLSVTGYLIHLNLRVLFPPALDDGDEVHYESLGFETLPEPARGRWMLALCDAALSTTMRRDPFWDFQVVDSEMAATVASSPQVEVESAPVEAEELVSPEPPRAGVSRAPEFLSRLVSSLPWESVRARTEKKKVDPEEPPLPEPTTSLRLILIGPRARVAFTDEGAVHLGDEVQGWMVTRILEKGMWVQANGTEIYLPLDVDEDSNDHREESQESTDLGGS